VPQGDANIYLAVSAPRAEGGGPRCLGGPASPAVLQGLMEQLAVIEGHNGDQRAALLDAAREHAEAAVELVLVTTRRPEADDHGGLEHLAADSAERGMLRQVRVVNTSTPELARYFVME